MINDSAACWTLHFDSRSGMLNGMSDLDPDDFDIPLDFSSDAFDRAGYNPLDPQADCFKPPAIPIEVYCIHCHSEYQSYLIQWRVDVDANGHECGFWCCPIPGCDGCGFGFDIFPIDPDYTDENGEKMWHDDAFDETDDLPEDDEPEQNNWL